MMTCFRSPKDLNKISEAAQLEGFLNAYDGDNAYNLAKKLLADAGEQANAHLYIKCMHACYIVSNCNASNELKHKVVLDEARGYGKKAFELEPNNNEVLKWCAIITGSLAEIAPMKEKIALGHEFKNYLDKAATNNPDSSIFHMRGRFAYRIANLSWLERTAATVAFGAPPYATLEEALADLLKAEEMNPGQIDNQLYIAKCYMDQGDEVNARKYLTMVLESSAVDDVDEVQQNEAKLLMEKLQKAETAEKNEKAKAEIGKDLGKMLEPEIAAPAAAAAAAVATIENSEKSNFDDDNESIVPL